MKQEYDIYDYLIDETSKIKKENSKIKSKEFKDELKRRIDYKLIEDLKEAKKIDKELYFVLNLAFWTRWLDLLCNEIRLEILSSKEKEKIEELKLKLSQLFEIKHKSISLMAKSKYMTVEYYKPEKADKKEINLCRKHRGEYKVRRSIYQPKKQKYVDKYKSLIKKYDGFIDFVLTNFAMLKECKKCKIEYVQNFYTVYYLKVEHEQLDLYFDFFVPYNLFNRILPLMSKIKKTNYVKKIGKLRFGRTIYKEEKQLYTEKQLIQKLTEAYDNLNILLK